MFMTKDDKIVCFNSNRQKIQSNLSYKNRGYGHDGATDRIYVPISYKILYLATYCFFLVISWLDLQIKINLFST